MSEDRPDPDELLARVRAQHDRAKRGKLTIFFGAAPGVGKTYAMLEAARLEKETGRDVVIGIVETHGRYDTGALLLGHEILPRRKSEHRGIKLEELDLDTALARRPGVLLVDELAHTNAPGSRHVKRWQDVQEILDAGIDVYTTLNVQHLESQRDVIAQVTHVVVSESVPDAILERADDVRLLDLPIDELLERLREGKVYVPEQATLAREHFFQPGNLIALRELALRLTAERVDAQMRRYREEHGIQGTWPVGERILVSVSPSPASERLIRAARRLATSLHAQWIAAYVETSASLRLSSSDRERLARHLLLAQSVGAEAVTLSGERGAEEIARFARSRNVTRILVGKPTHSKWRDRLKPPFLDDLVRLSGDIDVHVLTGEELRPERRGGAAPDGEPARHERTRAEGIAAAFAIIAFATVLNHVVFGRKELADTAMVYLLGIFVTSLRWGLFPSLSAAVLSVLAFDFFFVPPYHTFAVSDFRHIVTFAVMFVVATVTSGLTARVRAQAEAARERERRTASLYALSRALTSAKTTHDIVSHGARHLADVFGARVCVFLPDPNGQVQSVPFEGARYEPDEKERGVVEWVWSNRRAAGATTDTLPSASGLYLPLEAPANRGGVLGLLAPDPKRAFTLERRAHLEASVAQIGAAIDRARLAEQAQKAQLRIETEQLRNALLSSVSHDLRTPLAVITGTASTLLDARLDDAVRRELAQTVLDESERLNRLVRNLLDMTRLEAGAVELAKEWQPLEEAIGAALDRTAPVLEAHPVTTKLPRDLPLVPFDSILLQQVLVNLLENAAKYTPAGSPIEVAATAREGGVEVVVADRGKGLPAGEESKVFEKFYRAEKGRGGGVGLGLTICKGIVTAHGGQIWAENRPGGGAAFHFTLPIEGEPPSVELAEPRRESRAAEP
jgi:two-component system sensor histidine kinase KdpD